MERTGKREDLQNGIQIISAALLIMTQKIILFFAKSQVFLVFFALHVYDFLQKISAIFIQLKVSKVFRSTSKKHYEKFFF